jgi:hypothetical protein|tara:strand:+ start:4687 stop:5775 length:1089 start_codon:yes stop_codon:yes gene_type:complete
MITPLTEKLHLRGYDIPHWIVKDKKFYSKYHAIKECKRVGYEWPDFKVWNTPKNFTRPSVTFTDAVTTQCDIISDSYKKVRLFYSGGRDSHLILLSMLQNKSKLDEIAIYRRFPGVIDNHTNEFDQFDILSKLKLILKEYKKIVPIKFYDLLPEHFAFYSKNLEEFYFPFTTLDFFSNNAHSIAEWYPHLQEDQFVNVFGHAIPHVDKNQFFWIDGQFNMSNSDPYNLYFFLDQRNTDLAVSLAYTVKDVQNNADNKNWYSGSHRSFLPVKDNLNFPKTGTELDNKWTLPDVETNCYRWWLGKKEIFYMANALKSDIGRKTYNNMISFYEKCEKNFGRYFEKGSIYNNWIGGVSEKHTLSDL